MNYFEEARRNAFKPIQENPIILDFSRCRYLGEIHLVLKEKFGLPEYYGENWDALWDCLDGLFDKPVTVQIYGFLSRGRALREECRKMLEVFDDVHRESPNVVFQLIS